MRAHSSMDFIGTALEALARNETVPLSTFIGCTYQVARDMGEAPDPSVLEVVNPLCEDPKLTILAPTHHMLLRAAETDCQIDYEGWLKQTPPYLLLKAVTDCICTPLLKKAQREMEIVGLKDRGIISDNGDANDYKIDATWMRQLPQVVQTLLINSEIFMKSSEGQKIIRLHNRRRYALNGLPQHPCAEIWNAGCALHIANRTMIALGLD